MKQNRIFKRIFFFIRSIGLLLNVLAVLWLLLCLTAAYYDVSSKPSYLSFFSFTNVFAVAATTVFIVFWLFTNKKWYALISIITLIICYPLVKSSFGGKLLTTSVKTDQQAIKIMTWNVHLFDLGEWTRDKNSKNKIIEFIKEYNPDVLCLQEYYYDSENPNEPYTEMLRELGYNYYEFSKEFDYPKKRLNIAFDKNEMINIGHAVFSKFPLSNMQRYPLNNEKSYNVMGVDVALTESKKARLFILHLQSVTLSNEEVDHAQKKAENLTTNVEPDTKDILKKLMNASSKRAHQANVIDSILSKSELPNIVCGDFNDMPGSYVYRKIKGNLSDAFIAKGFGFGRTYRKIFPSLRIDYILYNDDFLECKGVSVPNITLSDHNPVIASFKIK